MTNYSFPEIVLVPFPFTDSSATKKRPVLLLNNSEFSNRTHLIMASMITSSLQSPQWPGDYEIKEWKEAGLLNPSKLRLGKIVTLQSSLILKKLGALSQKEIPEVIKNIKEVFGLF